mmetsp:Transcript_34601/g.25768  ORF Transcript_34601/g.25768 Transcript_34601/m.25768 type:complete len:121 (+) Transcript_34601:858-1220(+)
MKQCSFVPERQTKKMDKKYLASRKSIDQHLESTQLQYATQASGAQKEEEEVYYEKLYKKRDEYEAKKKQKLERMFSENTFQPRLNKSKQYIVAKDVIERNQEFIEKKNEKAKKRLQDEMD